MKEALQKQIEEKERKKYIDTSSREEYATSGSLLKNIRSPKIADQFSPQSENSSANKQRFIEEEVERLNKLI